MDEQEQTQPAPLSKLAETMLRMERGGDSREGIVKHLLVSSDSPQVVAGAVRELDWIEPGVAALLVPSGVDGLDRRKQM